MAHSDAFGGLRCSAWLLRFPPAAEHESFWSNACRRLTKGCIGHNRKLPSGSLHWTSSNRQSYPRSSTVLNATTATLIRRHFLPAFGDRRLCDIQRVQLQRFVIDKFHQGLSWQTAAHLKNSLGKMFGVAVSWNYLEDNPARGVKLPPRQLRRERQFLTPDQVRWLLGVLPEPMKTMVLVAVLSGLRVGEVLALRWKHLDLLRGTIHVRESVYEGRFSTPKTVSSRRSVPMSRVLKQVLLAHRSRLQRVAPDDLVFATKRGTAFSSKNLHRRVLLPACDTAGVPRVGWHAFRHTHATLLSELGESIKTAQAQLGHSSLQTTLEVYTHAVPETQRAAVERLEHLLLGGQLDPNGPKFPVLEEAGSGRVQ